MTMERFENMRLRPHDKEVLDLYPWVRKTAEKAIRAGHAYGCLAGEIGELIGFGFVEQMMPGLAHVMILTDESIERHPIQAVKASKAMIDYIFDFYKLHRLQAFVQADYRAAQRFIEAVGFELEGLLRMFTVDKKDTYVYSMVRA
jgi:RimJ/RimL family protein N-acetyltransferase